MTIWDRFRLDGKRALITGGSRGLGKAMASALAEAGADLVIVGRDMDQLHIAEKELRQFGHEVETIASDIATPAEAQALCARVLAKHGPIHILINNVGGRLINTPTVDLAWEEWRRIVDLNLSSVFVCSKMIGGDMVKRRSGRIINIASIAGMVAVRGIFGRAYETTKAAVVGFTKAIAADWAPFNVTANVIAPGGFMTDPNRRRFQEHPEFLKTFVDMVPMGRLGEPDEIGPLALFLASDASSYMTGATLVIDGGYTLW